MIQVTIRPQQKAEKCFFCYIDLVSYQLRRRHWPNVQPLSRVILGPVSPRF